LAIAGFVEKLLVATAEERCIRHVVWQVGIIDVA